jgi:hypothetical protein
LRTKADFRANTGISRALRPSDWLAGLSLANLVFLRCWAELLSPAETRIYWLMAVPAPLHYVALMLDVLLLGTLFYALMCPIRRQSRAATRIMLVSGLAILLSLMNSLRTLVGNPGGSLFLRFVEQRAPAIGVVAAILLVLALVFGGIRALRPVHKLLVLVSPFLLFTFGNSLYRIVSFDDRPARNGPLASRLAPKTAGAPRVVWVIFDEWDQDLTFSERPSRIQLPEIDRLRADGFSATQAIAPNMFTDWSMPALTTGIALDDIHPDGPAELMIRPRGSGTFLRWSQQDSVFREARKMGFNTAVVAWAIPYCRVLKNDLSGCWWWSGSNQYNSVGTTLPEMFVNRPRSLYENTYRSPFGQSLSTTRHIWVTENVVAKSLEVACDPGVGLALLHMPVPHPPYFYDAATGKNGRASAPITGIFHQTQEGYVDALALTDKIAGELRHSMEQAGVWDSTTVIFSADHPFRHRTTLDGHPVSRRVPYLVKMAGPRKQLSYGAPFSALLTRKLIQAILSGELSRPEEIPSWIDGRRADYRLD